MSNNPLTLAKFRAAFPAFRAAKYPDAAVQSRLALGDLFFGEDVWRDPVVRHHAIGLYTAHFLSIGGKDACGSFSGAGSATGLVASKSVDGASVSYDNSATAEAGAGLWNSTVFGQELYKLMRIYGAGAVQI